MPIRIAFFGKYRIMTMLFHCKITDMTFTTMPSSLLMPGGQDIDLFPMPSELTVAQAAKYLDGAEGLVEELLNAGQIAFHWENGERLVQWDSLLNYARNEKRRFDALAKMVHRRTWRIVVISSGICKGKCPLELHFSANIV